MSLQGLATTAILCGPSAQVDQDNSSASVWVILENEIPSSVDEIGVSYKGKHAPVSRFLVNKQELVILTKSPVTELRLNLKDIKYSNCEGDDRQFTVRKKINLSMSDIIVSQCRCFAD